MKLARLSARLPIVDAQGQPSPQMQRIVQDIMQEIETIKKRLAAAGIS